MNMKHENEMKWESAVLEAKARAIAAEMTNAANVKKDDKNIKVGDPLYLYTDCNLWTVRMCHDPYTVIGVKGKRITIQEARLVFNGPRYFDTLPDGIEPNPNGDIKTLRYDTKGKRWVITPKSGSNHKVAVFGRYDYQPYLD